MGSWLLFNVIKKLIFCAYLRKTSDHTSQRPFFLGWWRNFSKFTISFFFSICLAFIRIFSFNWIVAVVIHYVQGLLEGAGWTFANWEQGELFAWWYHVLPNQYFVENVSLAYWLFVVAGWVFLISWIFHSLGGLLFSISQLLGNSRTLLPEALLLRGVLFLILVVLRSPYLVRFISFFIN